MTAEGRSADGDGRVPMGEVLPGFRIHPLEAGSTPLEAFALIKILDDRGGATWVYRTSSPPNREELLGALQVQVDLLRYELLEDWKSDSDD